MEEVYDGRRGWTSDRGQGLDKGHWSRVVRVHMTGCLEESWAEHTNYHGHRSQLWTFI